MTILKEYDVLIIGGGLAGLTCALHLSQSNCSVLVIEKNRYPNHKVCGEYVSNEVLPYLNYLGIDPFEAGAKRITNFEISNNNGKLLKSKLDLGGFGLSRYTFDNILFENLNEKVEVVFEAVEKVDFNNETFEVTTQNNNLFRSKFVVGAFGKRTNIDKSMNRSFINHTSPWLAVKGHYKYDFPDDSVALHNFKGGYCGLSKTESNSVNACYLTTYKSFKRAGNIESFENQILSRNPFLKDFFKNATPLFSKPLTISQISFEPKKPIENHMFMMGDSAGLIHPLCGNGMAMAIHSAKIFSEVFLSHFSSKAINRAEIEQSYTKEWQNAFSRRLFVGRTIQNILLHPKTASMGFAVAKMFPKMVPSLIQKTHGVPLV